MSDAEADDRSWLTRLDALGWVRAGLSEVGRVAASPDPRAVVAGCKRAAGMALNGYLLLEFEAAWGRSYVEHLRAAAEDLRLPEPVRARAKRIVEAEPPQATLVQIRSPRATGELVEATKDVIAWVYAEVVARQGDAPPR